MNPGQLNIKTVGVVGAGAWGTALAILASRNGLPVHLFARSPDFAQTLLSSKENSTYLPGILLPENIFPTHEPEALSQCDVIIMVPPSRGFRELANTFSRAGVKRDAVWVSCTKGIEHESGKLMTEILTDELRTDRVAVLSGPNLAMEVAKGIPAAAVVGCEEEGIAKSLQEFFSFPSFRAYRSSDIRGIQLGGALKNIYAIGAGCSDGFGMGDNAKAALVTRSLAEMVRLGEAMGGRPETFHGLSGIGDLMVTCFSKHSRNRTFGERIGRGETPEQITTSTKTVAEGVPTALSAWEVAKSLQIETPVIQGLYSVLHRGACPKEIMKSLLERSPKPESSSA